MQWTLARDNSVIPEVTFLTLAVSIQEIMLDR